MLLMNSNPDFNMKHVQENGFSQPMVFREMDDLGMKLVWNQALATRLTLALSAQKLLHTIIIF